jgi:hypothetical protein
MEIIYRILRYLKSSPRKWLLFARHDHLKGYTDVDWAGSVTDQISTSVGGNLVT